MGQRGPKPEPSKFKLLKGNPGKRKINDKEPKPKPPKKSNPAVPVWLGEEGKKIWRRLIPKLVSLGLFTEIDENEFAHYCECEARFREAADVLNRNGTSYEVHTEKGGTYYRDAPEVEHFIKFGRMASMYAQKFGLSPSDRSRLEIEPVEEEKIDALEEALKVS